MKIVVAINYANFDTKTLEGKRKQQRQTVAIANLCQNKPKDVFLVTYNFPDDVVKVPPAIHIYKTLKRNSKTEIGNDRPLPYVTEILNKCAEIYCDVFGFINSDILLDEKFYETFRDNIDAYIFYRTEISEVSVSDFRKRKYRIIDETHPGNDGFFFKREWFVKHRKKFHNDLILGETEFDTCYRYVIKNECKKYIEKRALGHVYHDAKWNLTSPGAINNIKIWNELKRKLGINI